MEDLLRWQRNIRDERKLLPLGNEKKSKLSFCISLVYSYFGLRPKLLPLGNKNENFRFHFVFHSFIRNFAGESQLGKDKA